ncbi:phosphatase 2C-like domain-containing protein [Fimicolochytrium jonesii]|uniref:phosphatase 2C-like domain-containing protein n=1 Tax=Fimicolochytrium jonesii TaxID=1396493 RepID=UPI0022FECFDE|nr:phosphatase 2C-like domain-containing protein [Fimicolochytrium jonesii]KAI8825056.1 phosphatase 2C-like domain-containing protein [Fimicolochytrium jonesii]
MAAILEAEKDYEARRKTWKYRWFGVEAKTTTKDAGPVVGEKTQKNPRASSLPEDGPPPTPIVQYHINQVPSNDPIEDRHSEHRLKNGVIMAVFDGHSGTECADLLQTYLAPYISKALSEMSEPPPARKSEPLSNIEQWPPATQARKAQVVQALKLAFRRLDADICNAAIDPIPNPLPNDTWKNALRPALAGACAIVAYIEGNDLYVACTGDSRAVLGRHRGDGTFQALELSADQTTTNPSEYARLLEEHPGEGETVVIRGRILGGLMPTRAFGDAIYKWASDTKQTLGVISKGRDALFKSPPYVTADPEVTYYHLNCDRDKCLILATDGIWDMLSSDQAVDLGGNWSFDDPNAATHLIRNALGRGDRSLVAKLIRIPPPYARRARDDMTANVIFFSDGKNNGTFHPAVSMDTNGSNTTLNNSDLPTDKQGQAVDPFTPVDLSLAAPKKGRLSDWIQELKGIQEKLRREGRE